MRLSTLVTAAAFAFASACGSGTTEVTQPTVPDNLKAPATEVAVLKVFAKGTQNYKCSESTTAAGTFAWVLVAPDAKLYAGADETSAEVGKHYAGPTWESTEGSKFVGDSAAAAKADSPDANSIPWLLVPKKDAAGTGQFSKFVHAQRVNTNGGKAPATGCDAAHVDATNNVAYTANYYFYETK